MPSEQLNKFFRVFLLGHSISTLTAKLRSIFLCETGSPRPHTQRVMLRLVLVLLPLAAFAVPVTLLPGADGTLSTGGLSGGTLNAYSLHGEGQRVKNLRNPPHTVIP